MMNLLKAFRPVASDFLSTIVFIAAYAATGNVLAGTACGIATGVLQVAG